MAVAVLLCALVSPAVAADPPFDLWSPDVIAKIRDRSTLNPEIDSHVGYFDVWFDSEIGDARWAAGDAPYELHTSGTIRIHGYLATPHGGGPYPGIVVGHGHKGHASRDLAVGLASFGYVVLAIDGPGQGDSTGPPDTEQGWISVEEVMNEPAPELGYLYHYTYAGMRALTLLDRLSRRTNNPFRIDRKRLGVVGASMGGQFTYYVNGVDSRVKGAVALAVAGDWDEVVRYQGSWLYHGLAWYTRDGLRSGQDALNTVSNVCDDPTYGTFVRYFDPIHYAPTQHGPLLTIIGSHDQYFTAPGINVTYDALEGANDRFDKRILITPNGKHGVVDENDPTELLGPILDTTNRWLQYCFRKSPVPPATPTVRVEQDGDSLRFHVSAPRGTGRIRTVLLHVATQMDTRPQTPCDFVTIELERSGDEYQGTVPIGTEPPCGPAVTADNVLYFATVVDSKDFNLSSKLYYQDREMAFGTDFTPIIEHYPGDDFEVQPAPPPCSR